MCCNLTFKAGIFSLPMPNIAKPVYISEQKKNQKHEILLKLTLSLIAGPEHRFQYPNYAQVILILILISRRRQGPVLL